MRAHASPAISRLVQAQVRSRHGAQDHSNDADVDAFLAGVDDEQKREDSRTLCRMLAEETGEPPRMWGESIVGFGTYHYTYASGREGDWMALGFAPRKQNLTLYLMDGFDG